ncbi:MAG TPA: endonuclease III [Thermoanaerobaculales bacterium]|nr:endonuclease III [Thermoanaerobaculales bacterium]HPA81217.1 endonuclease III [Thermoanaerobaculales bacterium]HQL28908.1 endonuclease III [Thermoanaerobaculales bacterium]HQN96400.1 endonuclease III [Thermoanaerobaculales bacterium]HQP44847.1 endonuclease III [Thermoanaerobaculales bacterium]
MRRSERARAVAELLAAAYPEARCELDYRDPWELLVATVLSAQCTDERVNQVTPVLFGRWPTPAAMAQAPLDELEAVIRPTGFFRNKARALRGAAEALVARHGGTVPAELEALVELPGVGRKTAKVVLGEAFGIAAGIAVDTHVRRVAGRLGLTRADDPEAIAGELERLVPRPGWVAFSMRMILHGRRVCVARRPRCAGCPLDPACVKAGV